MLASRRTLDEARFWLAGSLAERPLDVLYPMLPALVIGGVLALAIAPALNALALGDDAAQALGVPVTRIRLAGTAAVVLLAGSAVAVAGPVAFIGLAAPHLVRPLLGGDHRLLRLPDRGPAAAARSRHPRTARRPAVRARSGHRHRIPRRTAAGRPRPKGGPMTDTLRTPRAAPGRPGGVRARQRRRTALLGCCAAAALLALATISLTTGEVPMASSVALRALLGLGDASDVFVVQEFRAPRLAAAVVAGAGLAVAGAVLQRLFRNPLASPDGYLDTQLALIEKLGEPLYLAQVIEQPES